MLALRVTISRMLIAIAIVAVALRIGVWALRFVRLQALYNAEVTRFTAMESREWDAYRNARWFAEARRVEAMQQSGLANTSAWWVERTPRDPRPGSYEHEADRCRKRSEECLRYATKFSEDATRAKRRFDYFARMKWKYERAAHYPWLPVEPDPLPPE